MNAGYAWRHGEYDFTGTDTGGGGLGSVLAAGGIPHRGVTAGEGGTFGGQVGYNYQLDSFVLGAEADIAWVDSSAKRTNTITATGFVPVTTTTRQTMDYFGTVRARFGYTPVDRLLVYATGGLAYGNPKASFTVTAPAAGPPLAVSASDEADIGWTVGAGLEYAFADNWTIKGEYLYYDLGKSSATATYDYGGDTSTLTGKAENAGSIVRVGLNYKFF